MSKQLMKAIKEYAIPLHTHDDVSFLLNEIDDETFVLLGESSHGTSEFYQIRSELSKRLIVEKGFTFIAVEGDWPACLQINRYIKGYDKHIKSARDALKKVNRWPTWMWANEEMLELIEWLKKYNSKQPENKKVGFYGIDIYSLWESMDEIIHHLEKFNSQMLNAAKEAFACFEPFNRRPEKYGVAAAFYGETCHEEVIRLLTELRLNKHEFANNEEDSLNIEINALITANAENYYRTMVTDDNGSWNIRDKHMVQVIEKISQFYGEHAKGIIWEHNTHVGDARATDMADEGIINVGQIMREQFGEAALFIVGFGTNFGTVIAADQWGVNYERMDVPKAKSRSWEDLMGKAGPHDKLLFFNQKNRELFSETIGHRAIGVVYNPNYEHLGNYVPSSMSNRYDAFIYLHQTNALTPLEVEVVYL
ncbi:erythromycin esterase family protein [Metabacillus niabensis]|uniref:erythromycin esterase family protein n=1 Tax=Metabacillus niabensis TaxID=324854 RepID=UPI0039A39C30